MGCGASAPAPAVVEAERAVRTHLQRIGLREDIATQRATDLVAAGYDTPEQFDRLRHEQLEGLGFRPGDLEKVATFRANGPPILATAVVEEPATETAAKEPALAPEPAVAPVGQRWPARALPSAGVVASETWVEMDAERGELRLDGPSSAGDLSQSTGMWIAGNTLLEQLGDEHVGLILGMLRHRSPVFLASRPPLHRWLGPTCLAKLAFWSLPDQWSAQRVQGSPQSAIS